MQTPHQIVCQDSSEYTSHNQSRMTLAIETKEQQAFTAKKQSKPNNPPQVLRMKSAWIPSLNNQNSQASLLNEHHKATVSTSRSKLRNAYHLHGKQNSFNSSSGMCSGPSRQTSTINNNNTKGGNASLLTHYQHINPLQNSDSHNKVGNGVHH